MPVAYINNNQTDGSDGLLKNLSANLGDAKFCLETGRLSSFDQYWPHHDEEGNLTKENMAKAGFFFIGRDDCVKCFACHVKLIGWDESDDPWDKHIEVSPNCIFAKFRKEEARLSVEQWCDVLCSRCVNLYDNKFNKLISQQQKILNPNN